MRTSLFKKLNIWATILFIVAHFATVYIYDLLVVDGEFAFIDSGVILHTLQASVYLIISIMPIKKSLRIASLLVVTAYVLIAASWLWLDMGLDFGTQSYFYDAFAVIMTALNLIIIYLLGRDGAIHIFNLLLSRFNSNSKIRLLFRSANHNRFCNINLFFSSQNIKNEIGRK